MEPYPMVLLHNDMNASKNQQKLKKGNGEIIMEIMCSKMDVNS